MFRAFEPWLKKRQCRGLQVVESREDTLHTQEPKWSLLRKSNVVSLVARSIVIVVFGLLLVGFFGIGTSAQAATVCKAGEKAHAVTGRETLSSIAARYATDWQQLAQHNSVANPSVIYVNQTICVPQKGATTTAVPVQNATAKVQTIAASYTSSRAIAGTANVFPYGQCTWWAAQRYHQIHKVYVPWRTNSNAWQWNARARQFGWTVSNTPHVGDIMVLQGNVQGAGSIGHVGIVEQVLGNGRFVASSMNWYPDPMSVTRGTFSTGRGVTFVHM